MTLTQRLAFCHRCPNVDFKTKGGKPPCKKSGRYFMEHVRECSCPVGAFTMVHPAYQIFEGYEPTAQNAIKGSCGC
jgi:hypothetical protein